MEPMILNRKLVHDGGWLKLVEVEASIQGKTKKWIYCSRNGGDAMDLNNPDAVVIVPFVKESDGTKIVLVEEYRIPLGRYQIGFPAGLIDQGETVESSACRELQEETGYQVVHILSSSPVLASSAGLTDETFQYLFVEAKPNGEPSLEDSEEIRVIKLSIEELPGFLAKAKTVCGRVWPVCDGYIRADKFPI